MRSDGIVATRRQFQQLGSTIARGSRSSALGDHRPAKGSLPRPSRSATAFLVRSTYAEARCCGMALDAADRGGFPCPKLDVDRSSLTCVDWTGAYSPKYFSAIPMPSSYIFWYSG